MGIDIKKRKSLLLEKPRENEMEMGRSLASSVTFDGDWLDFPTYLFIYLANLDMQWHLFYSDLDLL